MTDRRLLYAAGLLRSTAVAMTGVLLGLYLEEAGLSTGGIGAVVAAGLGGGAVSVLFASLLVERVGRKPFLVVLAALSTAGTAAAAFLDSHAALAAVAFLGMLNGMGRDRAAGTVLDQALLPATTDDRGRTLVIARYTLLQDVGRALGNLASALPALLVARLGMGELPSLRAALLVAAALQAPGILLYARLSPALAPRSAPRPPPVSPASRRVIARLCALFALDAVGGGFLASSLLTLVFVRNFHVSGATVSVLFAVASVLNALSHLGAAWLARRIGLVNTMVFTHVPGSLLMLTVAYTSSFPVAVVLYLLREALVEMDVPTRQSYVMAIVRPEERTAAAAATGFVRTAGWALGSWIAGIAMAGSFVALPLVISAGLKIAYDGLLWASFRKVKPPEES